MTEPTTSRTSRSFEFSEYAFAFIDILGQQDELAKLAKLSMLNTKDIREFQDLVKRTVGVVETARNTIQNFKVGANRDSSSSSTQLSPDTIHTLKQMRRSELKTHSFSDTMLMYCSLTEADGRHPIVDTTKLLAAIATAQLMALIGGTFLRGGIERGQGTELSLGDFYGPALLAAYNLENDVAIYPRVVVGKALVAYIQEVHAAKQGSSRSSAASALAGIAMSLMAVDRDSQHIVDYLGKGFRTRVAPSLSPAVFDQVVEATAKALESFKRVGNAKLAQRYVALTDYVERSRPNWQKDE